MIHPDMYGTVNGYFYDMVRTTVVGRKVTDAQQSALGGLGTERALRMIMRLPREQAEAVLLRVVIELDAKTAGQVLGKRAGAVRTAAYRGLKKLAAEIE